MTDEQVIKEFERWIDAGRPRVWYSDAGRLWVSTNCPRWDEDTTYIVDDEQAELRKLQIDKPETKFQIKILDRWRDAEPEELWSTTYEYRVKPTEWYEDPNMIGKPVWVRDYNDEEWDIDIFVNYADGKERPFHCKSCSWAYTKPVKPEECYQGGKE